MASSGGSSSKAKVASSRKTVSSSRIATTSSNMARMKNSNATRLGNNRITNRIRRIGSKEADPAQHSGMPQLFVAAKSDAATLPSPVVLG